MKKLMLFLLTAISVMSSAQQYPMYSKGQPVSYSDPAISDLEIVDKTGMPADLSRLQTGKPVKVAFSIRNNEALNAVPSGTCRIMLTLGSRLSVVNGQAIIMADPLEEYFRWTVVPDQGKGQEMIIGELIKDLPPKYAGRAEFLVTPGKEGSSTVAAQVLISNHNNPMTILSDIAPMNNFDYKAYTAARPSEFRYVHFGATAHGCAVNLDWSIYDKQNESAKFVIEASNDGNDYAPLKTVQATGAGSYTVMLEGFNSKSVTVRIRTELIAGGVVYSDPATVSNLCDGRFELGLSPNPMGAESDELTLTARTGIFNGRYNFRLMDASGREVKATEAVYNNQLQVKFKTGMITGGSYYLSVSGENGKTIALPFIRQ